MKVRPVPVCLRQLVKDELTRLVDTGKLTRVYSSKFASPTVNVRKPDGTVLICGDFFLLLLIPVLRPVSTTLPTIDEVISKVGSARVFSKIDLTSVFLQLPLNENSKKYTTINTSECLYQYNFLPFGLTASPGIFQSYMTKLLSGI